MQVSEVFGIQPEVNELSYIDRGKLDKEFSKQLRRKHNHIAIRGASKSGKSWLRQRVLQDPIIVQCRLQYTTMEIYRDALSRLDIKLDVEHSMASKWGAKISATGEAGFKLLAKVQGGGEGTYAHESTVKQHAVGKDTSDLEFIATLIRESGRTLVIEDFHYLSEVEQKKFAFDMKTLWDYKTFVVVVGVWTRENMLITLNPDLSDRIEELTLTWSDAELIEVLNKGCHALGLHMQNHVSSFLSEISYGNVGLLQKLALRFIDDELGIEEGVSLEAPITLSDSAKVTDAAMHVADQLNQLYQTFAQRVSEGIRTRKNATGIYAHAMAAIMAATDKDLSNGLSASAIYAIAHARQKRIQLPNLKSALKKFADLQVDSDGRGLVLAYNAENEILSVVDRQVLLYRRFATVTWPWEEIIVEVGDKSEAFEEGALASDSTDGQSNA